MKIDKPTRKRIESKSKELSKKRIEYHPSKTHVKKEAKKGLKTAKKIERASKKHEDYKPYRG